MPNILVADDSRNVQKLVTDMLKDYNVQVVASSNGADAIKKLPTVNPEVVLADVFLLGRDGFEVCQFIKKDPRFAHIPVILMVGSDEPIDKLKVQSVGAAGVLTKPFVARDLLAILRPVLDKAGPAPPAAEAPKPVEEKKPAKAKGGGVEKTQILTAAEIAKLLAKGPPPPEAPAAAPPPPPPPPPVPAKSARDTQELSAQQLAAMVAAKAEAMKAEAEPAPVEEFATRSEPVAAELGEGAMPYADLLAAPAEEAQAAPVEAPPEPEVPQWGEIKEEQKQPSPDEPPIAVQFDSSEPVEIVRDEPGHIHAQAGPLPELASSASEFMEAAAAPPPPSPPPGEPMELVATLEPPPVEEPEPAPAVPFPPIPEAAPPAITAIPVPQSVDPAMVAAVVEKVMERLGPQVLEQIARDVVRPLAEELLRRELGK